MFKTKLDPLILEWRKANKRKDWATTREIEAEISKLLPKPASRQDLLAMDEAMLREGNKDLADPSKRGSSGLNGEVEKNFYFRKQEHGVEKKVTREIKRPAYILEFYGLEKEKWKQVIEERRAALERTLSQWTIEYDKYMNLEETDKNKKITYSIIHNDVNKIKDAINALFPGFGKEAFETVAKAVAVCSEDAQRLEKPIQLKLPRPKISGSYDAWSLKYEMKKINECLLQLQQLGIKISIIPGSIKHTVAFNESVGIKKSKISPSERNQLFGLERDNTGRRLDSDTIESNSRAAIKQDYYERISYKSHARGGNSKPKNKEVR